MFNVTILSSIPDSSMYDTFQKSAIQTGGTSSSGCAQNTLPKGKRKRKRKRKRKKSRNGDDARTMYKTGGGSMYDCMTVSMNVSMYV
jgi:hypothetical protein